MQIPATRNAGTQVRRLRGRSAATSAGRKRTGTARRHAAKKDPVPLGMAHAPDLHPTGPQDSRRRAHRPRPAHRAERRRAQRREHQRLRLLLRNQLHAQPLTPQPAGPPRKRPPWAPVPRLRREQRTPRRVRRSGRPPDAAGLKDFFTFSPLFLFT